MIWSPSSAPPASSTASMRSPSPSKATPRSWPPVADDLLQQARSVAPQPTLMFVPSGVAATVVTSAPSRSNTPGAIAENAPLAQSTATRRPSRSRAEVLQDVLDVALDGVVGGLDRASLDAGGRRGAPRSPPRRASTSLCPSASNSLTPLYSGGLCEAEMTTPRSCESSATAGVGRTPPRTAVPPAETIPRASASSSTGPEPRVSRPTKTRPRPAQSRSAPEPLDEVGRERLADDAANAVGSEVRASHEWRRAVTRAGRRLDGRVLALRELRRLARLVQAGLLALHLTGVAREVALALQRRRGAPDRPRRAPARSRDGPRRPGR